MAKLVMIALVALMCVSLILASDNEVCGKHGALCKKDEQCCPKMKCRSYINSPGDKRCQVHITEEEIKEAHDKILGHKDQDE